MWQILAAAFVATYHAADFFPFTFHTQNVIAK